MVVGHVAPEAAVGGNLALVKENDPITVDADAGVLHLDITDSELAQRSEDWKLPVARYQTGVLAKYARLVSSASVGAVTSTHQRTFPDNGVARFVSSPAGS